MEFRSRHNSQVGIGGIKRFKNQEINPKPKCPIPQLSVQVETANVSAAHRGPKANTVLHPCKLNTQHTAELHRRRLGRGRQAW